MKNNSVLNSLFLALILLSGCIQGEINVKTQGADRSIPGFEYIKLKNPAVTSSSTRSVDVLVGKTSENDTVHIFLDSSCSFLLNSYKVPADTNEVEISLNGLAPGKNTFYTKRENEEGDFSNCSLTSTSYTYETNNTSYFKSYPFTGVPEVGLPSNSVSKVVKSGGLIAAITSSGMIYTSNEGSSFNSINTSNGLASNNIYNFIYKNSLFFIGTNSGLAISKDGKKFINKTTVDGLGENTIADMFFVGNRLYVKGWNSLSYSDNFGATFKSNDFSSTPWGIDDIKADLDGTLYGYGWGYFVSSSDQGETWSYTTAAQGLGFEYIQDIHVTDDGKLLVSVGNSVGWGGDEGPGGLYISNDKGATWTVTTSGFTSYDFSVGKSFEHPSTGDIFLLNNNDFLVSNNGGTSFTRLTTADGLIADSLNKIILSEEGHIYAFSGSGYSFSNNAGVTWSNFSTANGLSTNYVSKVITSGNNVFASSSSGLNISSNNGANFTVMQQSPLSTTVKEVQIDGSQFYVASSNGFILSSDGGENFTTLTTDDGLANNSINGFFIKDANKWYLATSNGVNYTDDAGTTWTRRGSDNTQTYGIWSNYTFDIVVNSSNQKVLINSGGGGAYNSNGLDDISGTWSARYHNHGLGSPLPTDIDMGSDEKVYVATSVHPWGPGGLSYSTNGGWTYSRILQTDGLISNQGQAVYVDPANSNNVFYGTNAGISVSTDGASTWSNFSTDDGLVNNNIKGFFVTSSGVWIICTSGGVSMTANAGASFINYTYPGGATFYSADEDSSGDIFFATSKGLVKFTGTLPTP